MANIGPKDWIDAITSLDISKVVPLISRSFKYQSLPHAQNSRSGERRAVQWLEGLMASFTKMRINPIMAPSVHSEIVRSAIRHLSDLREVRTLKTLISSQLIEFTNNYKVNQESRLKKLQLTANTSQFLRQCRMEMTSTFRIFCRDIKVRTKKEEMVIRPEI